MGRVYAPGEGACGNAVKRHVAANLHRKKLSSEHEPGLPIPIRIVTGRSCRFGPATAGYRLGYGGGFYDRTLQGLRARGPVLAVGFGFAAQEVAQVPIEETDQVLDIVVTEAGVVAVGR